MYMGSLRRSVTAYSTAVCAPRIATSAAAVFLRQHKPLTSEVALRLFDVVHVVLAMAAGLKGYVYF